MLPSAPGSAHSLPQRGVPHGRGHWGCVPVALAPAQSLLTAAFPHRVRGLCSPGTVLLTCSDVFPTKSMQGLGSWCCPQCRRAESLLQREETSSFPHAPAVVGGWDQSWAHPTPVQGMQWSGPKAGAAPRGSWLTGGARILGGEGHRNHCWQNWV